MNPNSSSSGAEASTSRKRKVVVKKEDGAGPSAPPQPSSFQKYMDNAMLAVSTDLSLASSPLPKSFVALLTQDDDEGEYAQLLQRQMAETDNLIQTQNENIWSGLQVLWNEMVEKMNKKVKEKEVEASIMKQIAECHKNNSQEWQVKAMELEQALASMRTAMHETLKSMAGWKRPGQQEQDEAESSFVDPGPMSSRVKCKLCDKMPAKVMMWPCRHVSVCLSCEAMAIDCPLCGAPKECFYKVNLS